MSDWVYPALIGVAFGLSLVCIARARRLRRERERERRRTYDNGWWLIQQQSEKSALKDRYSSAVLQGDAPSVARVARNENDIMSDPLHPLNPLNPVGLSSSYHCEIGRHHSSHDSSSSSDSSDSGSSSSDSGGGSYSSD